MALILEDEGTPILTPQELQLRNSYYASCSSSQETDIHWEGNKIIQTLENPTHADYGHALSEPTQSKHPGGVVPWSINGLPHGAYIPSAWRGYLSYRGARLTHRLVGQGEW